LCHGRATLVKVGSIRKEHREYTRNLEEWKEKSDRAAGAVAGAMKKRPKRFQRKGNGLSRLVNITGYPLNAYSSETSSRCAMEGAEVHGSRVRT
jgi:hypothetical protein